MYLTKEQVKEYIKSKIQNQSNSFEFRKMIVNTFIREIIFFEDKLIITYNFSDHSEPVSFDVKTTKSIERQSQSDSAFSFIINELSNFTNGAPKATQRRGFYSIKD